MFSGRAPWPAPLGGRRAAAATVLALALAAVIAVLPAALHAAAPAAAAPPAWAARLHDELEQVDAANRADIGVYVRDLDTGAAMSYHADEAWYLASTVKLPVAIAVLRGVEQGRWSLETTLTLQATDYVDGSGPTNRQPPGSVLRLGYLLEQMMIWSDNTATDLLIGRVGIDAVNALVRSLVPSGFEPITTMADVRRKLYSQLDPAAARLAGKDFLLLKQQATDLDRRQALARLLQAPIGGFKLSSVDAAYDAYYASGFNSGRLDAYGELLALLVGGKALGSAQTAHLLDVMTRAKTGPQRIKAGLPTGVRFAHKTGTQSARTCDSGIVTVPRPGRDQRVVVAACTRGEASTAGSDRALRQVGAAICRSGVLRVGTDHEPALCDAAPRAEPRLDAAER